MLDSLLARMAKPARPAAPAVRILGPTATPRRRTARPAKPRTHWCPACEVTWNAVAGTGTACWMCTRDGLPGAPAAYCQHPTVTGPADTCVDCGTPRRPR